MSRITDVIISATWQDAAVMEPLIRQDDHRAWSGAFALITGVDADRYWVHDGKGPVAYVWVGTFNHLNRPTLLADLEKLPWRQPHTVQVLIRDEEDDCFGMWMLRDGEFHEISIS